MSPTSRILADLILLLSAAIWGLAFVAQSSAMHAISPLWFVAVRYLISGLVVAPSAYFEARRAGPLLPLHGWGWIWAVSIWMFLAAVFQQLGIGLTTVTNAGFFTGLYVLLTPVLGAAFLGHRPALVVWPAGLLGLAGTALLGGGVSGLNEGDLLIIFCALFWAAQMITMERAVLVTGRPVLASCIQFLVTAALAALCAGAVSPFNLEGVRSVWLELFYAGAISGGIGFTLMAMALRHTASGEAVIILSAEAPFTAFFGYCLLGEVMTPPRLLGCALILAGIVLVQVWPSRAVRAG